MLKHPEDDELINKYIPNFIPMYVMFGGGVMPRRSRGTRGRCKVVQGRSHVREPEGGRHTKSSSGSANGATVRGVKFNDDDYDDFMPMPPPRRPPSPENPDDYKREPLFEPLPPPIFFPHFGPPHPPHYRFFSSASISMLMYAKLMYV